MGALVALTPSPGKSQSVPAIVVITCDHAGSRQTARKEIRKKRDKKTTDTVRALYRRGGAVPRNGRPAPASALSRPRNHRVPQYISSLMQLVLESLLRDVRYGLRSLRRSPGFAVAAILTLALGIGANTAIFSVLHGVVLSPLPYRQPDRLVVVTLFSRSLNYPIAASYPDFLDWQRAARSFEQMSAWVTRGFDLTSPGEPQHFAGKEISAGFFHTLGAKLAAGREFSPEEDRHGGT